MIAGMFAPNTPNEIRDATGYGVPVACDGRATRLHRKYTIVIPTSNATNTCQAANPNANRLPAVTYPPTLCTSDIQNAKKLYDPHVCLRSGARSSFVNRGAYPGLMTPAPARWWCSPVSTRTSPPGSAPPAAGGDVMSVMVSLLTEEGKLGATRKLLARRRHSLPPEAGKVPPRTRDGRHGNAGQPAGGRCAALHPEW